jgi:hypothetical protein
MGASHHTICYMYLHLYSLQIEMGIKNICAALKRVSYIILQFMLNWLFKILSAFKEPKYSPPPQQELIR